MTAPPIWLWALGGAGGGALAGSFIATILIRWPARRSIAEGRSRCDACAVRLTVLDLVPILSYAMLGGRCRRCREPIDRRHLSIEIAASLIGAASLVLSPDAEGVAAAVIGWLLLALAALDARHYWLPDALTLPLLCLGLAAGAMGIAPELTSRLIGAAAGYSALSLLAFAYAALRGRTGVGGGDAKLLAAIGAWLGWRALPSVVLLAALAGLAVVGARLAMRQSVTRYDRMPLGSLLAGSAWLFWAAGRIASPG